VLIGGVIDHQIADHAKPELLRPVHELDEIAEGARPRVDAVVVRHVIAVVLVRRGVERQQPQAGHAEPGQVGQPVGQTGEIADAVAVRVQERLDVEAVDDGVLVPEVVNHARGRSKLCSATLDTYQDRRFITSL